MKKKKNFITTFFSKSLFLLLLIFLNFNAYADNKIPIKELQRFINIIEHVKKFYIKDIKDNILFEKAIEGMLSKLDPHSQYMNKRQFSNLKENSIGKINGLGIEIIIESNSLVRIIKINKNSVANTVGLKEGDLILSLNNIHIKGLSTDEIIEIIKKRDRNFLKMKIYRENNKNKSIKYFKIIRKKINIDSVYYNLLNNNIAYIKIIKFRENTASQVKKAITHIKNINRSLSGLIIDLRNNPGGLLVSSVKIANMFLDGKKLKHNKIISYTKSRAKKFNYKEIATNKDLTNNIPIVVIVNSGSASASEILAGALQDHNRAIIVGTKTFGKGSVQTVLPITNNCGLKLTTSLFYSPRGRIIQSAGIIPDILIPYLNIKKDNVIDNNLYVYREISLDKYIRTKKYYNVIKKYDIKLINFDYQLYESCNVLKGLILYKKKITEKN